MIFKTLHGITAANLNCDRKEIDASISNPQNLEVLNPQNILFHGFKEILHPLKNSSVVLTLYKSGYTPFSKGHT